MPRPWFHSPKRQIRTAKSHFREGKATAEASVLLRLGLPGRIERAAYCHVAGFYAVPRPDLTTD
jgi:hypothetical protein